MKRFAAFNPEIEDVILWVGPWVRGSFSYINPVGSHVSIMRRYDGELRFISSPWFLELVLAWEPSALNASRLRSATAA